MLKVCQNAVFNPKWRKTQSSRNSCILWVDLMQNAFFREKWWKFGKTLYSTQDGGNNRFQERVVFHEWMWWKTPAKNGESLGKSSFQHKIEQKRVFNKKFYLLSGFVAKLFFRREMVKVWQPKMEQITVSKSGFNAKRIFREKRWNFFRNAVSNNQNGAKQSFRDGVIIQEWIWCKTPFLARSGEKLEKRRFQPKMEQTQLSTKSCILWVDLRQNAFFCIFWREMVKVWQVSCVFNEWICCKTHSRGQKWSNCEWK